MPEIVTNSRYGTITVTQGTYHGNGVVHPAEPKKSPDWWQLLLVPGIVVWAVQWPTGGVGRAMFVVSMPILLRNIVRTFTVWPQGLIFAGAVSNFLTICVNGGMPVTHPDSWLLKHPNAPLHHVARATDRLSWLWDRFAGFSVGDMMVVCGLLLWAVVAVFAYRKRKRLVQNVSFDGREQA